MEVSVRQAGQMLSRLINQARFERRPIIITARGQPRAVILSMEEYERLTQLNQTRAAALAAAQTLRETLAAQVGELTTDWVAAARAERDADFWPAGETP